MCIYVYSHETTTQIQLHFIIQKAPLHSPCPPSIFFWKCNHNTELFRLVLPVTIYFKAKLLSLQLKSKMQFLTPLKYQQRNHTLEPMFSFLPSATDPFLTLVGGFITSRLNYCISFITETSKSDPEIFHDVPSHLSTF